MNIDIKKILNWLKENKFIILIILFGTVLRFWKIMDYGFFSADEGNQILPLKYYMLAFKWCVTNLKELIQGSVGLKDLQVYLYQFGTPMLQILMEPGYSVVLALYSFILGLHDYNMPILSAFFSILTVAFIYTLSARIFDKKVGLWSALLMSLSSWAIIYAHCPKTITMSTFLILLGSFLYLWALEDNKKINKRLLLAGFVIGYSVTVRNAGLFVYLVFLLLEIFNIIKSLRQNRKLRVLNSVLFFLSMLIPIFIFEPMYWPAKLYNCNYHTFLWMFLNWPAKEYFKVNMALNVYKQNQPSYYLAFLSRDYLFFPYYFVITEGWLVFSLFILGSLKLIKELLRKITLGSFMIFLMIFLPLGILIMRVDKILLCPRILFPFFPFVTILCGLAIKSIIDIIVDKVKINKLLITKIITTIVIFTIIINASFHIRQTYCPSGFRNAAQWIKENIDKKYNLTTFFRWTIYQFYLERNMCTFSFPESIEQIRDNYFNHNVRYMVADYNSYYYGSSYIQGLGIIKPIEEKIKPIKLIDNPQGRCEILVADTLGYGRIRTREEIMKAPFADKIRIYDLKDYFEQGR